MSVSTLKQRAYLHINISVCWQNLAYQAKRAILCIISLSLASLGTWKKKWFYKELNRSVVQTAFTELEEFKRRIKKDVMDETFGNKLSKSS